MGGETTVTVRGGGVGGRNQELALAAAGELDGTRGAAILAFSSDGVDGPTDAAGAWVDGATLRRIRAAGLDPSQALSRNDSYPTLHAAGALVHTGPTGTNVADLVVGIRRQAI
jgi:glycerate-2-kinase